MTPSISIPANERHTCRVFTLDMPLPDLRALRTGPDADAPLNPQGIARLLGVDSIDPAQFEVFDVADLADLGLTTYLIEGNGVAEAQLARDRAALDAVTGPVLILYAGAFAGRAVTLRPDPRLTLIGTYAEDVAAVVFEPLPNAGAQGSLAPAPGRPPMSDARVSGMVAMAVLIFLCVFVAVLVWTAG